MAAPTERQRRGARGEAAALARLQGAGLVALARNVRYRVGELDLVMRDGAVLVFVEVRMRSGDGFGGALASVDARKRTRLVRAAALFLASHPALAQAPCRFDVVAITGTGSVPRVDWLRDAFRADGG